MLFAMVSILTLTAFVVKQTSTISGMNTTISEQKIDLKKVSKELRTKTRTNQQLEQEVEVLLDSIAALHTQIAELESKVEQQGAQLNELRKRITRRENKIKKLKKDIELLTRKNGNNSQKIKELEAAKKKLRAEIEALMVNKDEVKEAHQGAKEAVKEIKQRSTELNVVRDLINNTTVRFERITLRQKEHRNDLKKLKYNDKRWKYTLIDFYVEHENPKALLDATLLVKILDLDTGKVLPFNENNPNYPDSYQGASGIPFTYTGNKAEIVYYNNQKKQSMNYEVRIYLVKDGKEYPLKNGKEMIVEQGKVLPK